MQYDKSVVDGVIKRILNKKYRGCLNLAKISEWSEEHKNDYVVSTPSQLSVNSNSAYADALASIEKRRC